MILQDTCLRRALQSPWGKGRLLSSEGGVGLFCKAREGQEISGLKVLEHIYPDVPFQVLGSHSSLSSPRFSIGYLLRP